MAISKIENLLPDLQVEYNPPFQQSLTPTFPRFYRYCLGSARVTVSTEDPNNRQLSEYTRDRESGSRSKPTRQLTPMEGQTLLKNIFYSIR